MTSETISIDPRVALQEAQHLVEHYRNRALFLAQRLFEAETLLATAQQQIAETRDKLQMEAATRAEAEDS